MTKKIVITGATGLIGKNIASELIKRGEELIVFSRNVEKAKSKIPNANLYVEWDYNKTEEWKEYINNSYAVIHLAGANLFNRRWTKKYKKIIKNSRIKSSENLVKAIAEVENKPEVFICSSAVGFYGSSGDKILTEDSPQGNDFLSNLCSQWEAEAAKVESYGVRRVSIRSGIVLSNEEGVFKKILLVFKLFMGGVIGSGNQWVPWIHINDIINIYLFPLYNKVNGPINAASPNPVRMKQFSKELGKILHRPSFVKVPGFLLKIILGETSEAALSSLKVIPQKLNDQNFKFQFEDFSSCLKDLIK